MRWLALVSVLAVAACDSGVDPLTVDVSALSHDPAALVGTWALVEVTGYAGGEQRTWTPDEAGYWRTLAFRADGTAHVRSGEDDRTVPYEVRHERYPNGGQSAVPYLYLDGRPEAFGIDGDRLYLDARPLDGVLETFARR